MANHTVYPYGTGGQLPSGIAVINDLTTGGVDKALSAEMGKTLAAMIENTGLQCANVNEDGIFFVDGGLNIGASITTGGVNAINLLTIQDL